MTTSSSFQFYELTISTLGRVHIGTGEDIDPTNYVINKGILYEFPTDAMISAFSQEDRETLLRSVSRVGSPDMLKQVQSLIYDRRAKLRQKAFLSMPVSQGIAQLYRDRIQPGSGNQNALEVKRTYRNPVDHSPVLPGSSLKGAIRTALLNWKAKGNNAVKQIDLDERNAARRLEQNLFQFAQSDFHRDPMRLVQVGDAKPANSTTPPKMGVVFGVNRKKQNTKAREPSRDSLYQMLETVNPFQIQSFQASLALQTLGLPGDHHPDNRPAEEFDINRIAQACNDFYSPLLQDETALVDQMGYTDAIWKKRVATFESALNTYRKTEGAWAFWLRVGQHSGAEAVTIEGSRKIKIMQGKGQSVERDRSQTVWLSANNFRDTEKLVPFGWIFVTVEEVGA